MSSVTNTGSSGKGLDTEVQWLKGVGQKRAMLLAKLGLKTVEDVLWYFPRAYQDRRNLPPIGMLPHGAEVTVVGELLSVKTRPIRGGRVMARATVGDDTGEIDLVWFNQPWVVRDLQKVRGKIVAYGTTKDGRVGLEMASPEWEEVEDDDDAGEFARIFPVYPLKAEVKQYMVRSAARSAVDFFANQVSDDLPKELRDREDLRHLAWCLQQMHFPDSMEERDTARRRLVFEEFLYLQLAQQMRRNETKHEVGIGFDFEGEPQGPTSGGLFGADGELATASIEEQIKAMLPFELTGAQKRVLQEIWDDMKRPVPMNRLVQGDVGSGKTAVAACAMLAAIRAGYQTALMAPTEILAEQHYINLHRLFDKLGVEVALLVGKQPARQKKKSLQAAASGTARVCVGTHALISEGVEFDKLGLVIVDEQHRFGVLQRAALREKGYGNPDVLVMTATPIPRTLTMTAFGDLDVSVIDELPPGRKPIKTHWKPARDREKVYAGVRKMLEEGRQAYFVCPMINESEKMQTQAAEDLHYRLSTSTFKDKRVGLLHGQMKPAEKEVVMDQFRQRELDILVSTVVVEVGVDVPNATVMVIEDASRFGLSQLHQLRGRVGRGQHQSFCVLVSDATNDDSTERLKTMVETTDGFKIAEKDLQIRGPGDVAGTQQSGFMEFRVANLIQDGVMLEAARRAAIRILEEDPGLERPENQAMLAHVKEQRSRAALITVS
jgi:ATP-dependent DNA helicase RecG